MADGSVAAPFTDLKTALENPRLRPGHVIYLRAGVHFITSDTVISASNITVLPYPGEEASICFYSRTGWLHLTINGDNVRFRHLRIWSDPPHRMMQQRFDRVNNNCGNIIVVGDAPDDGLFADCRIDNLYDLTWYTASKGGTIYQDCDLLNNGMDSLDGNRDGEFLYTQNLPDAPNKTVSNCILGPCYSVSFQVYSEGSYAFHYRFNDLILCQSGVLYHSGYPTIDDIVYTRVMRLDTPYVPRHEVIMGDVPFNDPDPTVIVNACTTPGAKRLAHIGVHNPQAAGSVSADVAALGLTNGKSYRLRNALDPADITVFTYDGSGAIDLPMTNRSVATPIGDTVPLKAWDARYGAFVLETP